MKHQKSFRRIAGKLGALLLAAVMLTASLPLTALPAAAGDSAEYTPITAIHWRRVRSQKDIVSGYCLLFWNANNTEYTSIGGEVSVVKDLNAALDYESNEFYTTKEYYPWTLTVAGSDGDNKCNGVKMITAKFKNSAGNNLMGGYAWTICTHGTGGYASNTPDGYVQIIRNVAFEIFVEDGVDWALKKNGSGLTYGDDDDYDTDDFILFIGQEEELTQVGGFTVTAGNTFQLKDNAILPAGQTITVEPGAALSIEGHFFNNGTIRNYGTVVVGENSCVTDLDLDTGESDSAAGAIVCIGTDGDTVGEGSLIVLKNALLSLPNNHSQLTMGAGTTLYCEGVIIVPYSFAALGADIRVTETGQFLVGWVVRKYRMSFSPDGIKALTGRDPGSSGVVTKCGWSGSGAAYFWGPPTNYFRLNGVWNQTGAYWDFDVVVDRS